MCYGMGCGYENSRGECCKPKSVAYPCVEEEEEVGENVEEKTVAKKGNE